MHIYLVGGAVRDQLLGLPVHEKDWVVIGSTAEEMLSLGYQAVGKNFPVFLHPKTHEEYALARTEKKTGKGYKGFTFYASPNVSLIDDLKRRDLTINAMARTKDGILIDPYNGKRDLKEKIFHHISEAFPEDPVRLLRVARLSTKFPDFTLHPDTLQLMREMSQRGEVNNLVPERVWKELSRALNNPYPIRFFEVLAECNALPVLFPEIKIDGLGIAALKHPVNERPASRLRFASLCHDLSHSALSTLCHRYRIPVSYVELCRLVVHYNSFYRNIVNLDAELLLEFISKTDAFRRAERFNNFLSVCHICYEHHEEQFQKMKELLIALKNVKTDALQQKKLSGIQFSEALKKLRLKTIKSLL